MAGCCTPFDSILRDCEASVGGINRAWLACFDEAGNPTVTNNVITALGEPTAFKEFQFRQETGSFTTTINNDPTAGTTYYSTDIVLQFRKQETAKRIQIEAIAASDMAVIVEDNNGQYWYFGLNIPVIMGDGSTGETGTAYADFNGYNITLTSNDRVMYTEVTEAAMEAILNPEQP